MPRDQGGGTSFAALGTQPGISSAGPWRGSWRSAYWSLCLFRQLWQEEPDTDSSPVQREMLGLLSSSRTHSLMVKSQSYHHILSGLRKPVQGFWKLLVNLLLRSACKLAVLLMGFGGGSDLDWKTKRWPEGSPL